MKIISSIVLALGLTFVAAPVAMAGDEPPTPVPAECQPYYDSAANQELVAAQRLVVISDQLRTIEAQQARIERQHQRILRLRHRLHSH